MIGLLCCDSLLYPARDAGNVECRGLEVTMDLGTFGHVVVHGSILLYSRGLEDDVHRDRRYRLSPISPQWVPMHMLALGRVRSGPKWIRTPNY